MKNISYLFLILSFCIIGVSEAQASVLTFDDVYHTDFWEYIPDGYGGFEWENAGIGYKYINPGTGYEYGTVSGEFVGFNPYGAVIRISRDSLFDFTGVYLTSAWTLSQDIIFSAYADGSLLYEATLNAYAYSPAWYDFGFYGIDSLEIRAAKGRSYFVLDNFTWEESSAPVPEPATFILLASGLAAGGVWRRKKQRHRNGKPE